MFRNGSWGGEEGVERRPRDKEYWEEKGKGETADLMDTMRLNGFRLKLGEGEKLT